MSTLMVWLTLDMRKEAKERPITKISMRDTTIDFHDELVSAFMYHPTKLVRNRDRQDVVNIYICFETGRIDRVPGARRQHGSSEESQDPLIGRDLHPSPGRGISVQGDLCLHG